MNFYEIAKAAEIRYGIKTSSTRDAQHQQTLARRERIIIYEIIYNNIGWDLYLKLGFSGYRTAVTCIIFRVA